MNRNKFELVEINKEERNEKIWNENKWNESKRLEIEKKKERWRWTAKANKRKFERLKE